MELQVDLNTGKMVVLDLILTLCFAESTGPLSSPPHQVNCSSHRLSTSTKTITLIQSGSRTERHMANGNIKGWSY